MFTGPYRYINTVIHRSFNLQLHISNPTNHCKAIYFNNGLLEAHCSSTCPGSCSPPCHPCPNGLQCLCAIFFKVINGVSFGSVDLVLRAVLVHVLVWHWDATVLVFLLEVGACTAYGVCRFHMLWLRLLFLAYAICVGYCKNIQIINCK